MSTAGLCGMSPGGTRPWISQRSIWWSIFRNCMIVDVCSDKVTMNDEQTEGVPGHTHLFGHQEVPVVRVYRTLPAVVYSIVLIRPASRVVVLELKHDVREAVYGIESLRSVFPVDLVEIQVGAYPSRRVRSSVGFRRGTGRKRTHNEKIQREKSRAYCA